MKISIVVLNQGNRDHLLDLARFLFKENSMKVELIIIDSSGDQTIDNVFLDYSKELQENKIILLSFFKVSPSRAREVSLQYVTGDYVWFFYSVDKIKKNFLEKLIHVAQVSKTDIIEFDVKHSGPSSISWRFPIELEKNKIYNVQKRPIVYSLISPFLYNKIFKTSFLKKHFKIFEIETNYDTFYTYLLTSFSKTYCFIDEVGIVITPQYLNFNAHSLVYRQWNYLLSYFKNYLDWNSIHNYVEYAYVKYMSLIALRQILESTSNLVQKDKWVFRINEVVMKNFPNSENNKMILQDKFLWTSKGYKKIFNLNKVLEDETKEIELEL